jgi:hypothetical protein
MATLNQITVVSEICNTNVTIPQPVTTIVQVATPGPQGSQGPQGPQGVTGVSSQITTGSVTASVNIGTDTFKIESGSSTYLYISSSGNIGVSTTTPTLGLLQLNSAAGIPNPSLYINAALPGSTASLTVRASNGATANQKTYNPIGGSDSLNFIQLLDSDATTTTNQPIGRIIFSSNDSDSGGTKAFIEAVSEDATPDAFLAFGTNQSGSSVTERMRITSTGNVGIGTSTPSSQLHISGASAIMTLSPIDPLPTSNVPSASFATSGSGANLKPYFWNGSSWTAFALL